MNPFRTKAVIDIEKRKINWKSVKETMFGGFIILGMIFLVGLFFYSCISFCEKSKTEMINRNNFFIEKCAPLEVVSKEQLYNNYYSVICANENGESKQFIIKVKE